MALLGSRGDYKYHTNSGALFKIRTLDSLAAAADLEEAAGSEPRIPIGLTCRHYWLENITGGVKSRKKLIVDNETDIAVGGSVTIDGLAFRVRGYVGEKFIDS
jgi:hypothetical protein